MITVDDYFSNYADSHQSKGNKVTHYLGIPLIVFSTFGLLALVEWQQLSLGLVLWLATSIFYCWLDWRRGVLFSILTFLLYSASLQIIWQIHVSLFISGWILQGIGHAFYEKKSPAFLTNLTHLLIGPFWIFCRLVNPKRSGR